MNGGGIFIKPSNNENWKDWLKLESMIFVILTTLVLVDSDACIGLPWLGPYTLLMQMVGLKQWKSFILGQQDFKQSNPQKVNIFIQHFIEPPQYDYISKEFYVRLCQGNKTINVNSNLFFYFIQKIEWEIYDIYNIYHAVFIFNDKR